MNYNEDLAHYIAVTAILVKEGKYLIAKRAGWERDFPNKWTVPGGKIVKQDYINKQVSTESKQWYKVLEDAVRREVMEEVGLEIKDINYLTNLVYVRKDGIPCMVISLFATPASETIKLNDALTESAWISVDEVKNYEMIDGIKEEIMMVDNYLKTGKIEQWESFRNGK